MRACPRPPPSPPQVGNPNKQKWLHALGLTPASQMTPEQARRGAARQQAFGGLKDSRHVAWPPWRQPNYSLICQASGLQAVLAVLPRYQVAQGWVHS